MNDAAGNGHEGQFLCYAWGESDKPVAAIVSDREGVRRFIIDQWLGDEDSDELPGIMAEFDAPEWDMIDTLEWTFEIGGVRITQVFDVGPGKPAAWISEKELATLKTGRAAFVTPGGGDGDTPLYRA